MVLISLLADRSLEFCYLKKKSVLQLMDRTVHTSITWTIVHRFKFVCYIPRKILKEIGYLQHPQIREKVILKWVSSKYV